MRENFIALTIAGSDPGGGAGIQADLKTFHQLGVYGTSVVTLVTVQNTVRMSRVETLDAGLVGEQFDAVLEDLTPHAIKTGALGSAAIVEAVAARKFAGALVVDPVTVGKHSGKHGMALMDMEARSAMRRLLLPRAALVTPNLDEAAEMAGIPVQDAASMREAARRIAGLGAGAVLVKGGHLAGDEALDILWAGGEFREFRMARVESRHTHGTGCVYSAAITAGLARGFSLVEAVGMATKRFVRMLGFCVRLGLAGGRGRWGCGDASDIIQASTTCVCGTCELLLSLLDYVIAPVVRKLEHSDGILKALGAATRRRARRSITQNPFRGYTPGEQDVFVMAYPKSGQNWMLQIVYQLIQDHGKGEFDHIFTFGCAMAGRSAGLAHHAELRDSPLRLATAWRAAPNASASSRRI